MIKAYDYFGFIDIGAEEDDMFPPYEVCPLCINAIPPEESELIYPSLCLRCARIIHTIYAHPYNPMCQSVCIPVIDDSIQTLGLIKMKLYNMIDISTNTNNSDSIEIMKDLMDQTPADYKLLSLINSNLFQLLVTDAFNRFNMTFMVETALVHEHINSETFESFIERINILISNRGRTTHD